MGGHNAGEKNEKYQKKTHVMAHSADLAKCQFALFWSRVGNQFSLLVLAKFFFFYFWLKHKRTSETLHTFQGRKGWKIQWDTNGFYTLL